MIVRTKSTAKLRKRRGQLDDEDKYIPYRQQLFRTRIKLTLFYFTRINNISKVLAYVGYASHIPGQFIIDRTKSAGTRSVL